MRVYQLTNYISNFSEIRCFKRLYDYLSKPMNCNDFITYFEEFNLKNKITSTTITTDYLNKLKVGKNMLEPGWDINVSIISQKLRLYSFNTNNKQFPTPFNIYELNQFKLKLTEEYNNIVRNTNSELTISLDELTSDDYLKALNIGDNYITYKFKYSDGSTVSTGLQAQCNATNSTSPDNYNFNIIVSELVI